MNVNYNTLKRFIVRVKYKNLNLISNFNTKNRKTCKIYIRIETTESEPNPGTDFFMAFFK